MGYKPLRGLIKIKSLLYLVYGYKELLKDPDEGLEEAGNYIILRND